ncbi:hypothetical protein AU252_18260 [Pseudarthrobacter sulfonivorans]|uniref:Tyr recombinase domain-containing protein n=1 Tax=Pseudarthrobacter sulfonivorans TaxID=121292 RepID=A0A0U3QMV1_9MICC|nr:site-specific integrase [Pseudarthrobacter sulfonivorans]ALV42859.1 hypothetical protein AU252_18260 [Pseudarthrobacter sulfonivorans]
MIKGLCHRHYSRWHHGSEQTGPRLDVEEFAATDKALFPPGKRCASPACGAESSQRASGLCLWHHTMFRKLTKHGIDHAAFIAVERPLDIRYHRHEFSFIDLPPILRTELLLVLQERDRNSYRIMPVTMRRIIRTAMESNARSIHRLLDTEEGRARPDANVIGFLRYAGLLTARWRYCHSGKDMRAEDVWDAAVIALRKDRTSQKICSKGTLDFRNIRVDWLRETAKEYARHFGLAADQIRDVIRTVQVASHALAGRPHGTRPEQLTRTDAKAVVDAYRNLTHENGDQRTDSVKYDYFKLFQRVLREGSDLEPVTRVSARFMFITAEALPKPGPHKNPGRAIPDHIIRILDANLHLLAVDEKYSLPAGRTREFHNLMLQTIYQLLRDLGRRPTEIYSLPRDTLRETDDGQPYIIYDSHKTAEYGLELPVHRSTATIIRTWQETLEKILNIHPDAAGYLFPSPRPYGPQSKTYITPTGFHTNYWRWIDRIRTQAEVRDDPLSPADFLTRERMGLYNWRHTYAQRLSDNSTPPDVIKELMNHKSFTTSTGYIKITRDRQRKAIEIVNSTTIDRQGLLHGPKDYAAYVRESVSTPLGLCTEPSNVKAAGQSCPVRNKCGGCQYYRANLSHLPQIDAHIVALTADLIAAGDIAEPWVHQSLKDEIASYKRMRTALLKEKSRLTPEDNALIDDAVTLLQEIPAAAPPPTPSDGRRMLPLTPVRTPAGQP